MKSASQIAELLKSFETKPGALPTKTKPGQSSEIREQQRAPYDYNLGLDFGTAFSKCVLRDIRQNRAVLVEFAVGGEETFLVPSKVFIVDGMLFTPMDAERNEAGLDCLKMALYATVRGIRGDPWLAAVARHWPHDDEPKLHEKIEALVVFYLAALIRHARRTLVLRQPDFGTNAADKFSVTMAVPVAHGQESGVEDAFRICLNRAWRLAQRESNGTVTLQGCLAAMHELRHEEDTHLCEIYPEVSANVQAYIQAREGFQGLFLFLDVGAGTVDASAFIYHPTAEDGRTLSYYSAAVIPLGSSQIELRAAGRFAARVTDNIRRCKEGLEHNANIDFDTADEVRGVCTDLREELEAAIAKTAALARQRLQPAGQRIGRPQQWQTLKLLIGGGGSALPMYSEAAQNCFAVWHMTPALAQLPLPSDEEMEWPAGVTDRRAVFRRISVAYGLSFDFPSLSQHRFPDEIEPLPDQEEECRDIFDAESRYEV